MPVNIMVCLIQGKADTFSGLFRLSFWNSHKQKADLVYMLNKLNFFSVNCSKVEHKIRIFITYVCNVKKDCLTEIAMEAFKKQHRVKF